MVEWCHRDEEDWSKWCRDMMDTGLGYNLGNPGCYNPYTRKICLGAECVINAWEGYEDKDKVINAIIDVICHEEDHKIIHKVTRSIKASRYLDLLFTGLYNWKENMEYFRFARFNWFPSIYSTEE